MSSPSTPAVFDAEVMLRVRACAQQALSCEGAMPSPCQSICVMDKFTGWCTGCLRNLNEIAAWGSMADAAKRQVWTQIQCRLERIPSEKS